jgi:metacaspase-1
MANRKALCVGINQFKNYPGSNLQGCVADANDMSQTLKAWLGFTDTDIVKLTDAQATKANIMAGLKSMVADARAGKLTYIVFSLSSHGTQVPDLSGDEPDRADEAFCPHDLAQAGNKWDPNHIITDDELRDQFVQLPPNVLLEVYLDTCHSGTGLRTLDLLLDRKPRYMPPPSLEAFDEVANRRSRGLRHALQESAAYSERSIVHHILWSGCRADQTSADAQIAGGWHGAFTYFFCKEMNAAKNQVSRSEIMKRVRAGLKAGRYTQIPQLEAEATKRGLPIS